MQGFELTTYWSIVSFHEHYTRVPAQLNNESVGTFYLKKPVFVFSLEFDAPIVVVVVVAVVVVVCAAVAVVVVVGCQ